MKRWMNPLAPALRPAFAWNHHRVMGAGARGLARHLDARLVEAGVTVFGRYDTILNRLRRRVAVRTVSLAT